MRTPESLDMVADFHRTFHHPILPAPKIPNIDRCRLRITLIKEELAELEAAVSENNMIGIADALCDIQYVLSGAVLEFGLGHLFADLFEEIQRSNMSKACSSEEEAKTTVDTLLKEKGIYCKYLLVNDKWIVYRSADQKTMKSIRYTPPSLEKWLPSEHNNK